MKKKLAIITGASLLLAGASVVSANASAKTSGGARTGVSSVAVQAPSVSGYPISQVPFTAVKFAPGSFLGERVEAAREVTIPLAFSKCETENRYGNFQKAAHPSPDYNIDSFMGFPFDDTDVYKTVEGASYVLATLKDGKHKAAYDRLYSYIDSVLDIVGAAQEPDGYLYTARTINPGHPQRWAGPKRWVADENLSHELYNLGHMVDAACAHYQATGSSKFLDIARRYADCAIREVGDQPGLAYVTPGHQIAEMAMARLYTLTGDRRYLDFARYMLENRGKTPTRSQYSQSHKPVLEQREAVGHAVRAGYMYAGIADVAALTGDSAYIATIDTIWNNIVSGKYYLTGGVGARHAGESFGDNYELPNLTAYNETCAAISMVYLGQRMFQLHGDSKYIDFLERTLYNGVLSGMSADGGRFFYPNPLACDGRYRFNSDNSIERQPWFGCACCPSNLSRFIPSLPGYVYAVRGDNLYVNLYAANTSTVDVGGRPVELTMDTRYPWNGDIAITVNKSNAREFTMKLRIPGWMRGRPVPSALYSYADSLTPGWRIEVNGKRVDAKVNSKGYIDIARKWRKGDTVRLHFDMEPRLVVANPKVKADRGRVALERGPIVYCAEWADNPEVEIKDIVIPAGAGFEVVDEKIDIKHAPGESFDVKALVASARALGPDLQSRDITLRLIPYFAWNHRGAGPMQVWLVNNNAVITY